MKKTQLVCTPKNKIELNFCLLWICKYISLCRISTSCSKTSPFPLKHTDTSFFFAYKFFSQIILKRGMIFKVKQESYDKLTSNLHGRIKKRNAFNTGLGQGSSNGGSPGRGGVLVLFKSGRNI